MKKIVGCRVSDKIYDKIKELDVSQSDFLRNLIENYFSENKPTSKIDVNRSIEGVNSKQIIDESFDIDSSVDLILKRKNDE